MNKPILAAAAGVAFGLFVGALYFGNLYTPRLCCRSVPATVVVQSAQPAPAAPPRQLPLADTPSEPSMQQDPLTAAQTAYVDGDYAQAIELARSCRTSDPTRAWRITGVAACQLHDPKLADEAFRRLKDSASRQYMLYACQRCGMTRLGRHFQVNEEE